MLFLCTTTKSCHQLYWLMIPVVVMVLLNDYFWNSSCCVSAEKIFDYRQSHARRYDFRQSVSEAIKHASLLLNRTRDMPFMGDDDDDDEGDHLYDDKFAMAEWLTNVWILGQINALESIGLLSPSTLSSSQDNNNTNNTNQAVVASLESVWNWAYHDGSAVSLVFEASENCDLVRQYEEEAEKVRMVQEEVTVTEDGDTNTDDNKTDVKETETETEKEAGKKKSTTKTTTTTATVSSTSTTYEWNHTGTIYLFICREGRAGSTCDPTTYKDDDDGDGGTTNDTKENLIMLLQGKFSRPVKSKSKNSPILSHPQKAIKKLNLLWLLQQLNLDLPPSSLSSSSSNKNKKKDKHIKNDNEGGTYQGEKSHFQIDRSSVSCKTPSRNNDVAAAVVYWKDMYSFFTYISDFLRLQSSSRYHDLSKYCYDTEFVVPPIMPVMKNQSLLSFEETIMFLEQQQSSLKRFLDEIKGPEKNSNNSNHRGMFVLEEARMIYGITRVMINMGLKYACSLEYLEELLRKQLSQAIGKQVTAQDFEGFMRYHNKHLFAPPSLSSSSSLQHDEGEHDYAPKPISHSIRQPGQFPVGMISIESFSAAGTASFSAMESEALEPVQAFINYINGTSLPPMKIPISASISAEITGDRYLTGWMQHRFSEPEEHPQTTTTQFALAARTRQFSSLLLLVGSLGGPDTFHPKHAIILKNKDEVLIPLLTNPLPSAKEFKDAIVSLSPEQQAFAKSFRGMQLSSSVFGICVVQLKPQLEMLLGLPKGALTKEVQLTEDLLSLFVDYQIPSDLLSFDGDPEAPLKEKVAAVQEYVKAVLDMIETTKQKQFEEEKRKNTLLFEKAKVKYMTTAEGGAGMRPDDIMMEATTRSFSGVRSASMMYATAGEATSEESSSAPSSSTEQQQADNANIDAGSTLPSSSSPSSQTSYQHDFTLIPKILDAKLEQHDTQGYLRSTIISVPSENWEFSRQENLLTEKKTTKLSTSEIQSETKKAFDLLDALSRSGSLPLNSSELHVIIGLTHYFPCSIIETIIEQNINPIEKVELSSLLLASTIYGTPVAHLLAGSPELDRLSQTFPAIFEGDSSVSSSRRKRGKVVAS